jgi:tetratricopeptide (TPR) repeat protein
MHITPVIPDGYDGQVKRLTCRICKHLFYLAMADYERLGEVSYCHECSLILLEELGRNQMGSGSIPPAQTPLRSSLPFRQTSIPVHQSPEPVSASSRSPIHVPLPRSIDREKMTVAQLLEEAKMLDKTWRYKEALFSYEQALQRDPGCLEALYGKGEMLSQLDQNREALAVYEGILQLDPTSARAWGEKGYALISLDRYTEAQIAFDYALQRDPSDSRAQSGSHFLSCYIFHTQEVGGNADRVKRQTAAKETLTKPCRSARDYHEAGNALISLKRYDEAFAAFARSIELDPLNLDVYERVASLRYYRGIMKNRWLCTTRRSRSSFVAHSFMQRGPRRLSTWNGIKTHWMPVTGQLSSMRAAQALTPRRARFFTCYGDSGKLSMHLM